MADGGVGEQAAEAGLRDRGEIPDHHRERGEDGQDGHPSGLKSCQLPEPAAPARPTVTTWAKTKKLATLELEAMNPALVGRSTLVGVRRPEMEWGGGYLEAEADRDHDDGDQR